MNGDRDHELLIEIKTTLDMFMKQMRESISRNDKDHALIDREVNAAHKRIDFTNNKVAGLAVTGVLAVLLVILAAVISVWKL